MRITVKKIIEAIKSEVASVIPDAEHYFGRLEETASRPAFLYLLTYQGENKANYHTSRRMIEIQIIYFGSTDGDGIEDYGERYEVLALLDEFMSQFELAVEDRWLHFTSEVKEADEQMAIYLTFSFLDEAVDRAAIADSKADPAEAFGLDETVSGS